MSKQTAVEFLIQQIELALKLNKVQINFEYRIKTINPVYEIARKMEREQIKDAYKEGFAMRDTMDWEFEIGWTHSAHIDEHEESFAKYWELVKNEIENMKGGSNE